LSDKRIGSELFIERSLRGALAFFKEAVFSEDTARSEGLLQLIPPTVKLVLILSLIVTACFLNNIIWLVAMYALSLALAVMSGIHILYFLKRVWVFIPLFTLIIAIPAVFMGNLYSACIFVTRVAVCVSFAVLLTVTTRHRDILRSLAFLKVPPVFIQVLDMTYRYIFFLITVFEDMHLALKSRLVCKVDPKTARGWVASRMGYMFKRSMRMSEEVYLAMLARGYSQGEVRDVRR
jgi:cobalt/nickel transport system permease protein